MLLTVLPAACSTAGAKLWKLYCGLKKRTAPRNNDETRIEGILQEEEPLEALIEIAKTLKHRLDQFPELSVCPEPLRYRRASLLRDFITVTMIMIPNAFRPGTGRRLTWRLGANRDPIGNLRYRRQPNSNALVWYVNAPKEYFKNGCSFVLEHGFTRDIPNTLDVYDYVLEYLEMARPLLVDGAETDTFIVRTPEFPAHDERSYSEYVRRLTRRVMTSDPKSVYHGATSVSCNQNRKIVGTSVARAKGLPEAANALANNEPQVYTHVPAELRSRATVEHVTRVAGK